ncbi:hypothetical protein [Jannaschia sp. R86511]|uniref:hypothetical protein n=1 Tax=Jannaschia sp. R86511 TaxID=3093853 RepID=UPI0036D3A991
MTAVDAAATPGPGGTRPVHRGEVDGVPLLWCDAPGPLRAHLMLRAGWADETLPTRGWTHLVEHLALAGVGRPGEHSNGRTGTTVTDFHVEGGPDDVVAFLGAVTRNLSDLPVARLRDEVGVLHAEQARRGGSTMDRLLSWRYGATDYGLGGMDEVGLSTPPPADALRHWAARRAARGNAVVWLSGPPPAGLRLHLADGEHVAPPDPNRCVAGALPAWFTDHDDLAAALAVVPRGWASPALRHVAQARLVDRLRVDLAVAYSPVADYSPVSGGEGWLLLHTDLVGGRQSEGVGPLLRLLDELGGDEGAPGAVTDADVAGFHDAARRQAAEPYAWASDLARASWDTLLRHVGDTAAPTDVTAAEVRARAREAAASLLAAVPRGLGTYRGRWVPALATTADPVQGTVRRALGTTETVVTSPDGVSRTTEGTTWTVRRDAVAGVLHRPDGQRVLVGADGVQLLVEPTVWEDGAGLVRDVDRTFPADRFVAMAPRAPGQVPVPLSTAPGPPRPTRTEVLDRWVLRHRRLALVLWLLLVMLVLGGPAAFLVVGGGGPPPTVAVPLFWGAVYGAIWSFRRRY